MESHTRVWDLNLDCKALRRLSLADSATSHIVVLCLMLASVVASAATRKARAL